MRPLSICRCVAVHDWETPRPLWHGSGAGNTRHFVAGRVGVAVQRNAAVHLVAVAARVHAEVRVVGVVLLHVDDDVLDLREQVDALGPARVGPVSGLADVVRKRAGQVPASGEQHARARRVRTRSDGGRPRPWAQTLGAAGRGLQCASGNTEAAAGAGRPATQHDGLRPRRPRRSRGMFNGAHVILYSADAELDRAFLRDVCGFANVDAGGGWLIFQLPPAEVAVHPTDGPAAHELYLMCDDVARRDRARGEGRRGHRRRSTCAGASSRRSRCRAVRHCRSTSPVIHSHAI